MPRYPTSQISPPPDNKDGDSVFFGMNMKTDPASLEPGFYAEAINKRCWKGKLEPRKGTLIPVFANSGLTGPILGSAIYSNPNGVELLLIATATQAYAIREGTAMDTIAFNGFTMSGAVELTQQFNIVLLQQLGQPTKFWNGDPTVLFKNVTKSNTADVSTKILPSIPWSVNFGSRCVFPGYSASVLDTVTATLILDYTTYDPINAVVIANTGTSDNIIGFIPYANANLIVAKQRSMDLLINFLGDLTLTSATVLSSEIGLAARKAVIMAGNDVHFLSRTGVHAVSQVFQDRIAASPVPLSDPIQPLLARINWPATGAVAASISPYDYFAVPIDGSSVNNCMLV